MGQLNALFVGLFLVKNASYYTTILKENLPELNLATQPMLNFNLN